MRGSVRIVRDNSEELFHVSICYGSEAKRSMNETHIEEHVSLQKVGESLK